MKHLATISKEFVEKVAKDYWDDLSYFEQRHYIQTHPKTTKRITATPPIADKGQQMCPICGTKFVDRDKVLSHIKDNHSFADTTPEAMEAYKRFKNFSKHAKKMKMVNIINELPPLSPSDDDEHKELFFNYGSKIRQQLNTLKEPIKYIMVNDAMRVGDDKASEYVSGDDGREFYENVVDKLKLVPVFEQTSGDEPRQAIMDFSSEGHEFAKPGILMSTHMRMRIARGNIDNAPVIVSEFYRVGLADVKNTKGVTVNRRPYEDAGVELFIGATDEENKAWEQRKQEKINRPPRKERKLDEKRVRRLGRQIARELKADDMYNDDAVYDVAKNYLDTTPGLKEFLTNKGIKENFMTATFADYISL
jgi:hypothetical protein